MKFPVAALLFLAGATINGTARGGDESTVYELKPNLVVTPSRMVESSPGSSAT